MLARALVISVGAVKPSPPDTTVRPPPAVTLRRLLSLAWPERVNIALATVFLFLGSATSLAFPQAVGSMMDRALDAVKASTSSTEAIDRAALVLAGIFLVQGFAMAFRFVLFSRAGERIVNTLRADLFESIINQETAFFDEQKTGDLANRLSSDTRRLAEHGDART